MRISWECHLKRLDPLSLILVAALVIIFYTIGSVKALQSSVKHHHRGMLDVNSMSIAAKFAILTCED